MKITTLLADDAVLREVGSRIARHRIDRGLSQQALAFEAGVAKRTLERLESGEQVQLATLVRILRVLGLLDTLDLLVPDVEVQPVRLLQDGMRQRKRAPRKSVDLVRSKPASGWKWGDEK